MHEARDIKYWIVVVSKDHVEAGRALGVVQANHGKSTPMQQMQPGDMMVFYSSKLHYRGKGALKKFTAIARVKEGDVYRGDTGGSYAPYRRDVEFLACAETDILPLIQKISFIEDKQNWGYVFRFGFFEIPQTDFATISHAMGLQD